MGDRILMLHNGKIVYDIKGDEKRRVKAGDLLALFDEIRRKEQVDPTTAEMLMKNYV